MPSVEGAVVYLGKRLGGENYIDESPQKREQALQSAIDTLARYKAVMEVEAYDAAVYEQALWMLSSRAELQSQGVVSYSLSGLSESFSTGSRPADVAPNAWKIVKYGLDGSGSGAAMRRPIWLS